MEHCASKFMLLQSQISLLFLSIMLCLTKLNPPHRGWGRGDPRRRTGGGSENSNREGWLRWAGFVRSKARRKGAESWRRCAGDEQQRWRMRRRGSPSIATTDSPALPHLLSSPSFCELTLLPSGNRWLGFTYLAIFAIQSTQYFQQDS